MVIMSIQEITAKSHSPNRIKEKADTRGRNA